MKHLLPLLLILLYGQISFCQFTAEESKILERGFPEADVLSVKGLYPEAIAVIDSLLLEEEDEFKIALLNRRKATFYTDLYNQQEGMEPLEKAKNYWLQRGGDTLHIEYAKTVEATGFYEKYNGNYPAAEATLLSALNMFEKLEGKDGSDYPNILATIGSIYSDWGKYEKAQSTFDEALPMVKSYFGDESSVYMTHLNNYAVMCSNFGRYDKSIDAFLELLPVIEKVLTKEDQLYHFVLNNLARDYNNLREPEKAISLLEEAIELTGTHIGKDNVNYAAMMINLAQSYGYANEFEKAEPLYMEALEINVGIYGRDHPNVGPNFNNLAYLQKQMGKYEESEKNFLQVLYILETHLGKNHFYYRVTTKNIAELYIEMNDFRTAEEYLERYYDLTKQNIEIAFAYLSEHEKAMYIRNVVGFSEVLKSINLIRPNPDFHHVQYDLALFDKGLLLNNSIATRKYLEMNADPAVQQLQTSLINTKQLLSDEYSKPPSERVHIDSLQIAVEDFEKLLAKESSLYRKEYLRNTVTSKDLMSQMGEDELAIEFLSFEFHDPYETDSIVYTAAIIDPATQQIHYTYLCDEANVSLFSKTKSRRSDYVEALYSKAETMKLRGNEQASLYELIWEPLEKYTKGKKKIFYSSAGLFNRINLGAIIDEEGMIMSEKFELANYSSTRSILDNSIEYKNNTAYLIGGVTYESEPKGGFASAVASEETVESDLVIDQSLRGDNWEYLPGTLDECRSIVNTMSTHGFQTDFKSGGEATEESFKLLGTEKDAPRVIHLASHGFFFPDPNSRQSNDSTVVYKVSENSMLRSGILFAGANESWSNEGGGDDGILTAFEIANMNLSQTELVVLSACETGLGDINGTEGVYGLQRAFKKAGVKNLIMSLWKVPDSQTSDFMSQFYKNWLDKQMTIRKAFDTTQKEMKVKYDNPYAWAGFVLIE